MAALIGLPFDIFATICHFLAPFDVLALIQTCQTLYNDHKSSELFIWIDQLRTTTAVNQSFLTASCLRDMQIKDLKHAATAPFRMLRKLEEFSHRGTCLEYASRKMISFRDRDVTDLFLVPGGRHLILLSQKRIEVWDLSTNYHTPNPIKRRVSVDDDAAVKLLLRSVTQHSSPGKSALRIVTHSIREHASFIIVYEFVPQSPSPTILGKIRVPEPPGPIVLRGDLIIFSTAVAIEFWNFETGRRLTWTISNDFESVAASSSIFIFSNNELMQAWKLPAELKKPHSAEQVIPAPPPDIKYLIFGSGGHLRVNDWYSASENLLVDHLARDHLRRTIFSHNIKGEPVAGTTGTWKAEHRIDYISHPQYRLCEDRLVCAYSGMQHTRAFVIPQIPAVAHSLPSPVPSSSPTAASLDLAISQPTFKASFDPISGRMCCLTTHDTAKLVIYDFLKQPL